MKTKVKNVYRHRKEMEKDIRYFQTQQPDLTLLAKSNGSKDHTIYTCRSAFVKNKQIINDKILFIITNYY